MNFNVHIKRQFSMHINHFHSLKRNDSPAALTQAFCTPMCSFNASIPRNFGFLLFKMNFSDNCWYLPRSPFSRI